MGILSQDHSHLVERSSNHIQFIDILSIQSCFLERYATSCWLELGIYLLL